MDLTAWLGLVLGSVIALGVLGVYLRRVRIRMALEVLLKLEEERAARRRAEDELRRVKNGATGIQGGSLGD